MVRIRWRASNLLATNSFVRASSRAGFDGGLVLRRSSTGSMMPRWKKLLQMRLARLLAKNGFSGDVSQSAYATRRSPFDSVGSLPPRKRGGCFALVRGLVA